MGFCKLGEGADYVKEGHLRLGGKMPTNTDGGLLSNSHCGDPSGMHTIEVVRQLRGECGARQVPDAEDRRLAAAGLGRPRHGRARSSWPSTELSIPQAHPIFSAKPTQGETT